jgi:hypothetical protein
MVGIVRKIVQRNLLVLVLLGAVQCACVIDVPVVYEAVIEKMTDGELVDSFNVRLRHETGAGSDKDAMPAWGDGSLSQLPMYRIAILKAIMNELKKRQSRTGRKLLTDSQIEQAERLIIKKRQAMHRVK